MAVLKLVNGWLVDTSTYFTKQRLIQTGKYTLAFSVGSFITSIFIWGWLQKLSGLTWKQLLVKIIMKRAEIPLRKLQSWRMQKVLSTKPVAMENKGNITLTRPCTAALGLDAAFDKLFQPIPAKSPQELLDRVNGIKSADNSEFFASLFPFKSCISKLSINQRNDKTLNVWKCNWPGSSNNNGAILHFDGGAFITCKNGNYENWAAVMSKLTGMTVYLFEWGVAPKYLHPSGVNDVIDGYKYILEKENMSADKIYLSGDSAGGCVVLLALQKLASNTNQELPDQPFGAILSSPVCDLSTDNKYYDINLESDSIIKKAIFGDIFSYSVGNIGLDGKRLTPPLVDIKDESISPLFGEFKGIKSKLYFWVSLNECMYGEIKETIDKCKENNLDVEYEENQWVWHSGMPTSTGGVPECRDSAVRCAQWINRKNQQKQT